MNCQNLVAFSVQNRNRLAAALVLAAACSCTVVIQAATADVSYTTLSTNAYGTTDINSVGIIRDNLTTFGGYQYAAFYDNNGNIVLGRRNSDALQWNLVTTDYRISSALLSDDHNVIAIGVDSNGYLNMSWGMFSTICPVACVMPP